MFGHVCHGLMIGDIYFMILNHDESEPMATLVQNGIMATLGIDNGSRLIIVMIDG